MKGCRSLCAVLCLTAVAGCYAYDPAPMSSVRPEMRVQARLTEAEAARLGSIVPLEGRVVRGEVVEADGREILLLVPISSDVVGARVQTLEQRLRVPTDEIIEIETRRLDRLKTGLVLGAGIAVLGGIAATALDGGFRSDRPGPGGGPVEILVPIGFTVHVGR